MRFFGPDDFSRPDSGRDKIVWSTRFRRARRTSVRRAAKSGAEKAKTFNFMQESVRIPTHFPSCGTYKRLIRSACFRFFVPDNFSRPETGRDKIVWSTRFRRSRRTSVRRAAKSGAEKAKTSNFKQESVRIPTHFPLCGTYKRLIRSACFRFFGPDDFSLPAIRSIEM